MEKLINEENEWDHRILARVKEGPAACIRIDEVAAALKKMKRQSPKLVRAGKRLSGGILVWLYARCKLHVAQLMPLPVTISCLSKSRLVLPSWFYLSGAGSPG